MKKSYGSVEDLIESLWYKKVTLYVLPLPFRRKSRIITSHKHKAFQKKGCFGSVGNAPFSYSVKSVQNTFCKVYSRVTFYNCWRKISTQREDAYCGYNFNLCYIYFQFTNKAISYFYSHY